MEEPTSSSPPITTSQPQPPTPNMDEPNSSPTPPPITTTPPLPTTQLPIPNMDEPKSNPTPTVAETQLPTPNMDDPKSIPTPVSASPPTTVATTELPPLAPSSKHQYNNSKKRKISDSESNYFRVRAIVSHLRPHFIEILRTSDFRNSRAAREIQRQMKLVVDTYKLIVPETEPISNDLVESKSNDPLSDSNGSEMKSRDGEATAGTCIIGGSDLGLNFITYDSGNPVYYGIAKESRRAKK